MTDAQIKTLLRLHDEPCLYITEIDAHRVLMRHSGAFMDRLTRFYLDWGSRPDDVELPVKQVFTTAGIAGDFRVMPCTIETHALKAVKVIGTNEEQRTIRDKICVGKAMLIDPYDNHVFALFDVCALSSFRTAAIACLAYRATGRRAQRVGLAGAGRIGFYTAHLLHSVFGLERLDVCDPDDSQYERLQALCAHELPALQLERRSLDALCTQSDALFLSTTSAASLCNKDNSGRAPFIASVGADADNLSEIDASLLDTHRLITDSRQSLCLGDMHRWHAEGLIDPAQVTELSAFIHEPVQFAARYLFISTGVAVQDALVCQFIYQAHSTLS